MAIQKVIITDYPDGSRVMSGIRNNKGIPVFKENDTVTATRVTTWYDGTPMDNSKADGKVYLRHKASGDFYLINLPNWGETFLEKDTMAQMRVLTSTEVLLLKMGYYKGVKLNGYYTKGDTPAPIEYKLSTTSATDDGGSVIEVGGIKLISENITPVDYRYFGAKLDLSQDDTDSIKNAHLYANSKNYPLVCNNGIIRLTDSVIVSTSVDFTGSTILVDDLCHGKKLFQIKSKNEWKTIEGINQSQLTKGAVFNSGLVNYKNHFVKFESDEVLCQRLSTTPTLEYKSDSVFTSRGGYFSSSELIHDMTTGSVTVTAREFDYTKVLITGVNIEWKFTNKNSWAEVFVIDRSNVSFDNVSLNIPNEFPIDATVYRRMVFNITNCYKFSLKNALCENISHATQTGYLLYLDDCIDVNLDNVKMLSGWGASAGDRVKNWTTTNSVLNRIDVHISALNIKADNVYFTGGWGMLVGYGRGNVEIINCTFDFSNSDITRISDSVFRSNGTYGYWFEGDVIVDNINIITRNTGSKKLLSLTVDAQDFDYKNAYDVRMPSLYASNIRFVNQSNESLTCYDVQDGRMYYWYETLNANSKKIHNPRKIVIKDVYKDVDDDSSYTRAIQYYNNSRLSGLTSGRVDILLQNINQSVHSYYTTNIPSSVDSNTVYKPLINFRDIVTSNTFKHKLRVINSDGGLDLRGAFEFAEYSNSRLTHLDFTQDANYQSNKINISNCIITPRMNVAKTNFVIYNQRMSLYNSVVFLPTYDSTSLGLIEIDSANRYINNILEGSFSSVSQAIVDKLWMYYRTAIYKKGNSVATILQKGEVNQSTKVDDVASANASTDTSSTATDVTGVVTDLNDLISKYNNMVTLVNELKTKINAKFGADRTSGQQSTT